MFCILGCAAVNWSQHPCSLRKWTLTPPGGHRGRWQPKKSTGNTLKLTSTCCLTPTATQIRSHQDCTPLRVKHPHLLGSQEEERQASEDKLLDFLRGIQIQQKINLVIPYMAGLSERVLTTNPPTGWDRHSSTQKTRHRSRGATKCSLSSTVKKAQRPCTHSQDDNQQCSSIWRTKVTSWRNKIMQSWLFVIYLPVNQFLSHKSAYVSTQKSYLYSFISPN